MDAGFQSRYPETVTPRLWRAGGTGPGISPELTPADGPRRAELDSSHDARSERKKQVGATASAVKFLRPDGTRSIRSTWSEGMSNRKPISKRQRWQILERDGFACRYCGRKAPDVTLEIDHMKPVVGGGCNCQSNLITACFDCNRGKGVSVLHSNSERSFDDIYKTAKTIERIIQEWFGDRFIILHYDIIVYLLVGHSEEGILFQLHQSDPSSDHDRAMLIASIQDRLSLYVEQAEGVI